MSRRIATGSVRCWTARRRTRRRLCVLQAGPRQQRRSWTHHPATLLRQRLTPATMLKISCAIRSRGKAGAGPEALSVLDAAHEPFGQQHAHRFAEALHHAFAAQAAEEFEAL